jgi:flagellar motility protein MotE (MotC chaperone)
MTRLHARWRGWWRSLCDGSKLVRGAGHGFALVVLIQGALLAERASTTSPTADTVMPETLDFVLPEPAAGPEPIVGSAGPSEDMDLFDLTEQHPECDPNLLRTIQERSRQLDAWVSDLAARARLAEAIEARAREQVQALQAERRALEATLVRIDQDAEAEIVRLVKIYESMKPKDAARIFEAMPAEVAAGFGRRMDEKKSAVVMGNLKAEQAYAITLAMANHHVGTPSPGESGGSYTSH